MKFSLGQKILVIFGVLILIATFIGIQSIKRFNVLGKSIDVILKENYISVIACQRMKESLERIDSGLLFLLAGNEKEGKEIITTNLNKFNDELKIELNNLTLPEEPHEAFLIKELFNQYRDEVNRIITQKADATVLKDSYFKTLFPLFQKIKDTADEILRMNQQNMYDANQIARQRAAAARRDMYFFLLICLGIALFFMFFSNRWILKPIHRLIDSANEISKGNLNLVVEVDSHDEIGQLSEAFNTMAENLRFFRRADHTKFLLVQRSIQEVFNRLPEAIAIVDSEGTIELATEDAQANFNLIPDSRIVDNPHLWLTGLYLNAAKSAESFDNKHKTEIIQQFINNEERFFQPMLFPILSDSEELHGYIVMILDVTSIQQSGEIKKNLLSNVSHQFKTPLTSIRMALHLLLAEKVGTLNSKQVELLNSAQEESERLNRIIESLLDISRIELGKAKLDLIFISPQELISDAVASFKKDAQEKGIEIYVDLQPYMPAVMADKSRISHVFSNLLSNAIQYTPFGGKIMVSAHPDDESVEFSVSDTGIGIPEEYQPRVFKKFFRVPGQDSSTGEGLGLALAKEIIEAHGGEFSFESTEGKGTTFKFTLKRHHSVLKGTSNNA